MAILGQRVRRRNENLCSLAREAAIRAASSESTGVVIVFVSGRNGSLVGQRHESRDAAKILLESLFDRGGRIAGLLIRTVRADPHAGGTVRNAWRPVTAEVVETYIGPPPR